MNVIIFILSLIITKTSQEQDGKEELAKLEKEEGKVFKQINEAIDDTIKSFKKSNDSDSLLGISYMEDLKKQIKDANKTGRVEISLKDKNTSKEITSDTRRNKKIKLSVLDIANIFTKRPSKTRQIRDENQMIMQKKIDEWIKQRELERVKIQQYKVKQRKEHAKYKYEICPRFGKGGQKKKGLYRRTAQGNGSPKYPCCRKCCKKSYLGCL